MEEPFFSILFEIGRIEVACLETAPKFLSLTAGELRATKVGDLEAELSALWQSAAADAETKSAVTRASVLTLLIYVESEAAGIETLNLIDDITFANPCRAIVMIADRGASPGGITASISAHCRLPSAGEKQVCCEQIILRARGEAVEGLKSVVLSLTIPELPVYLWWQVGRFAPLECLKDILRSADRLLVDSALFSEAESGLAALTEQIRSVSGPHPIAFSDLNWARLTPWRENLARCFDRTGMGDFLRHVTHVQIEWAEEGQTFSGRRAQGLLLTSWLAGRLGWKPVSSTAGADGVRTVTFESGGQIVRVKYGPRQERGDEGAPFSIRLETGPRSSASFVIQEPKAGGKIATHCEVPGRPPIDRVVTVKAQDEAHLVHEELRFPNRDLMYEEALNIATRIARV